MRTPASWTRWPALMALTTLALAATACSPPPASGEAAPGRSAAVSDSSLMARGLDLIRAGKGHDAVAVFRDLLAQNPDHYGAQYQLGRALDLAGWPEQARPEWEKMRRLAQAHRDSAHLVLIEARLAQSDTLTEAQFMARGLARLYHRNEPGLAVVEFSQVIERNPNHYGANYQLAKALEAFGQPGEARQWWVKVLSLAEAANDQVTIAQARARIAATP